MIGGHSSMKKWKDAGDIESADLSDKEFKILREMSKKPHFDHYETPKKKKKKKAKVRKR